MNKIQKATIIGSVVALIVIPFLVWKFWWHITSDYDLRTLPQGESYNSTRYEFRYGSKLRIIHDPHNHIRFLFGDEPDSISVTGGVRLIVFNSQKAVLKTQSDSIDVFPESVSHKGYMGISSVGLIYEVDEAGELQPLP